MIHSSEGMKMMMDDDMKHFNHTGGNPFCRQDGMIMYMDGFRFALNGNQPCLNFYFPGWTLDSPLKFVGAMVVIVLMAILTEGISRLRFQVQHGSSSRSTTVDDNREDSYCCCCCNWLASNPSRKRYAVTALHGMQACVGYVLMLATMTYSVEFLICVVLGLGAGYTIFYNERDNHVTTNPCCNFMQGEADERAENLLAEQQHHHQQQPQQRQPPENSFSLLRQRAAVTADSGLGIGSGWNEDVPLLDASVAVPNTSNQSDSKRYGV